MELCGNESVALETGALERIAGSSIECEYGIKTLCDGDCSFCQCRLG